MTSSMTRIDKVGMWDFEGLKRLKLHRDRDEPETRTAGASGRTLILARPWGHHASRPAPSGRCLGSGVVLTFTFPVHIHPA